MRSRTAKAVHREEKDFGEIVAISVGSPTGTSPSPQISATNYSKLKATVPYSSTTSSSSPLITSSRVDALKDKETGHADKFRNGPRRRWNWWALFSLSALRRKRKRVTRPSQSAWQTALSMSLSLLECIIAHLSRLEDFVLRQFVDPVAPVLWRYYTPIVIACLAFLNVCLLATSREALSFLEGDTRFLVIYGLYHTGTIDMRRWSAGQLSRVERFIDRKDSRIMDYGTGPGFTYKALVDKGYTNVWTLDNRNEALPGLVDPSRYTVINGKSGDDYWKMKEKSFDVAISLSYFHRFSDKEISSMLWNLAASTKKVLVVENCYDSFHVDGKPIGKDYLDFYDSLIHWRWKDHAHNTKTFREWILFFEKHDFLVIEAHRGPWTGWGETVFVLQSKRLQSAYLIDTSITDYIYPNDFPKMKKTKVEKPKVPVIKKIYPEEKINSKDNEESTKETKNDNKNKGSRKKAKKKNKRPHKKLF